MENMAGLKKLLGERILVTGGTGFVGSHLTEALVARGAQVVVPFRSIDPRSYFSVQKLHKDVILAVGDLKDYARVVDIVTKYEITYIFHLAAQPIVTTAYVNPLETIATNVMATANILEASRVAHVKGVIVTSSDKAYGKSNKQYIENHPLRGDHPYEASKSAADLLAQAYAATYRLPVVITRFGNIYGPGDLNFSRIVPGIMQSILKKEPLSVRSDGTFVRDYVYVGDIVSAYLWILRHFDLVRGEALNVASETTVSVLELIKKAKQILKKPMKFQIENSQVNEIPYQHLSWDKIKKLGWSPKYTLRRGLTHTYKWYRKNRRTLFPSP